jgi:diguanylate cyclase (GGDEF)-like protein
MLTAAFQRKSLVSQIQDSQRSSHRSPLVPAALILTLMWCGVLVLSVALSSMVLVGLGAGGLMLTAFAIGFLHRHQEHLRKLAETDSLTDLTNHGGFHSALSASVHVARQRGDAVSVVAMDLDDFKAINDNHGHPYGDTILKRVGSVLKSRVRDTDVVARIGGEEFGLILPRTNAQDAYEIAERVRGAIEEIETRDHTVTSSAGIASYPTDASDSTTLYELADGALYWAKRAGKRRTRHYDPEQVPRDYTEQQRAEIRRVLAKPELLISHFQPVVALATGQVVGYEALARFQVDPPRPPIAWFMQANGCGLGPALEAAAIKAALEPLGRPPGVHLAINVSPSAVTSRDVQDVLPKDLTDLVIEITEHEAIRDDDESLSEAIEDLRDRGALVAIDDAGAGYSGLKQLAKLKPDIVKLDRNLIQDIHTDPARMALIESFVRFSNRIGATVCAEGIETPDELAALADLDVQWGQGFFLARPAERWPTVSEDAADVCRAGLDAALRETSVPRHPAATAGDRGLEHLSARLAGARTREDLEAALGLIARELNAGMILLSQLHADVDMIETLAGSRTPDGETRFNLSDYPLTREVLERQEAVQVLIGDPGSDPAEVELLLELGHSSLLMVPVVHRGESLGLLEAFSGAERPWTRAEINRARIIASQFASVIEAFFLSHGNGAGPNGAGGNGRAASGPDTAHISAAG